MVHVPTKLALKLLDTSCEAKEDETCLLWHVIEDLLDPRSESVVLGDVVGGEVGNSEGRSVHNGRILHFGFKFNIRNIAETA